MERVAVILHLGESATVNKVWRFEASKRSTFTRKQIEEELLSLFPDVVRKGLRFEVFYEDELVGEVVIESDRDAQEALTAFVDATKNKQDIRFRSLHVKECGKVLLQRDDRFEPLEVEVGISHKSKKRKHNPSEDSSSMSSTTSSKRVRIQPKPKEDKPIDLSKVLSKCMTEDGIDDAEKQPLYIDHERECIACHWCENFKGSNEARVINQHVKTSSSHKQSRQHILHPEKHPDPLEESEDHSLTSKSDVSHDNDMDDCDGMEVERQGLYDRKYVVLYDEGNAGSTSAKKLWEDGVCNNSWYESDKGERFQTVCCCCMDYSTWKHNHKELAQALQTIADKPCYYRLCDEDVCIYQNQTEYSYRGTIRALASAPKGACTGIASNTGPHPYTCDACEALQHGKSSQLLRKFNRIPNLKHPRNECPKQKGVQHKYRNKATLTIALQNSVSESKCQSLKICKLSQANEKLIHQSWSNNPTVRPFIDRILQLFESQKLTTFDLSFLQNWLGKKVKGQFFHADEQARNLAILLSNRLGEKMYSTIAPMMGLPLARQAQKLRAKDCNSHMYMPGLDDWVLDAASKRELRPLQNSMDGTRVIRAIELYADKFLVGESFPPDVRLYPQSSQLPTADSWEHVQTYILSVREQGKYAAEANSLDLVDTTGHLSDLMIGSIPEATSGVTGSHIYAIMLEVEKRAGVHNVPLVGHCTDSAANALNALLKLATPTQFLIESGICFIGLSFDGFLLFSPFFRNGYPSTAYPCWDHSSRTSVRNLINRKRSIIAGTTVGNSLTRNLVATIQDLCLLKQKKPSASIKHSDISPYIHQNCDATSRVLTNRVISELAETVPGSEATQLYLQASVWLHAPFRNENFGPPTETAQSLWSGIMTWRRWRQFIIVTPGLSLTQNFISRKHYLTLELLAHAGINHLLCLYLCFPDLELPLYSLRNTGNRSLEAIHSIFRGGTTSLPITSPNLTFQDFLSKMNKAQQIVRAEHKLKKIDGNSIVASKKKRKTFAKSSKEQPCTDVLSYSKPSTYDEFVLQLTDACSRGDEASKKMIEKLAPGMACALKREKQWENPCVPLDEKPEGMTLISSLSEISPIQPTLIDSIMDNELSQATSTFAGGDTTPQTDYALANLLVDIEVIPMQAEDRETDGQATATVRKKGLIYSSAGDKSCPTKTLIKKLQPQREGPSKDRSRRFAAGSLRGDQPLHYRDNQVQEYQYWTLFPNTSALKRAKLFLLGQVLLIVHGGKPCREAENCPDTLVVLSVFKYSTATDDFKPDGKTAPIKSTSVLHVNVTDKVQTRSTGEIMLNLAEIDQLQEYKPFSDEVDVSARLTDVDQDSITLNELQSSDEEDEYVVEKVVKKKFNSRLGQYEFLVKWKDYSERFNTWELASNIPDEAITSFELSLQAQAHTSTDQVRREGLRDRSKIKARNNTDYIRND